MLFAGAVLFVSEKFKLNEIKNFGTKLLRQKTKRLNELEPVLDSRPQAAPLHAVPLLAFLTGHHSWDNALEEVPVPASFIPVRNF